VCDTLVVVWPNAVGFAKNSDRDPNEAQRLDWIPAQEHPSDSTLRCTWISIPQVRRTRAVLLSRPFWTWGAEMGANDAGLVVGNEAVFTRRAFDAPGLTGLDLVRLALERAGSVRQAVDVISQLIQTHGQGGRAGYSHPNFRYHNSFLIADPKGAAVLETAGREIAVEPISQGVRAISNGLTIPSMQPHADRLRGRVAQCCQRRARMELLGQSATCPSGLAMALRDHGGQVCSTSARADGCQSGIAGESEFSPPVYRRLNGALSAPCVHYGGMIAGSQTVASWISYLSPNGVQHWATGTSSPCISVFRPISLELPRDVGAPEGYPDAQSLWWRFERLHRRLMLDWSAAGELRAERDAIERVAFANPENQETHWQAADRWLIRWEQRIASLEDRRPGWLRHRWQRVLAEAAEGNRMPPRQVFRSKSIDPPKLGVSS